MSSSITRRQNEQKSDFPNIKDDVLIPLNYGNYTPRIKSDLHSLIDMGTINHLRTCTFAHAGSRAAINSRLGCDAAEISASKRRKASFCNDQRKRIFAELWWRNPPSRESNLVINETRLINFCHLRAISSFSWAHASSRHRLKAVITPKPFC